MKTYTTAQPLTATAVITALVGSLALVGLYLIQQTAHALRIACRLAQQVAKWLRSSHTFADDEDPAERVTLTGWQYIGFAFAVSLFALFVSIDWDRTLANF